MNKLWKTVFPAKIYGIFFLKQKQNKWIIKKIRNTTNIKKGKIFKDFSRNMEHRRIKGTIDIDPIIKNRRFLSERFIISFLSLRGI